MTTRIGVVVAVVAVLLLPALGCGSSPSSPSTTAPPAAQTTTPGPSQTLKGFKLYGDISEVPPGFTNISGARVEIVSGAEAGMTVVADGNGSYSFNQVKGGSYTLRASRDGFQDLTKTVSVGRDYRADFLLYPIPPPGATARCKDKSWSFVSDAGAACTRNGGVSYWVCPGVLCQ
jgi:carboxypeptidase family protein